jgi:PAS domain S-box-containing protein
LNCPVFDSSGEIRYLLHCVQDVTDRIAERAAATSAERGAAEMRAVFESIADAFYLLDREWRFTHVNDAAEPLLHTTRDKLLGRTLWEMFPDVIGSVFEGPYREAMATGRPTTVEAWFEPLGAWFDVRSYPWPGGLMVHFRDVSERKAAEAEREQLLRALEVERSRLAEVFRRAPTFITVFRGPEQVYDFVNEAYYQLVGHREIVGKPLLEALPEIRGQGFEEILERVRQTGEPWVGRETPVLLQRTPGAPLEARYLDMVFQPMTEADGTRSGVVVHGSDITAQVLARREVEVLLVESERARDDAEAANRAKSEFLAVMSHELRTPLNAIGGYAELIELGIRGPVTAEQRADLERIQQSQRHLLGLINGVLNYARVEAGAVHYAADAVQVAEVLATCEALIAPQVRARGLMLERTDCDEALLVLADREKLQQIVLNLLSNAVKFTDPGGHVSLRGVPSSDGTRVIVQVTDTGIGIAAEQLEHAFEPFVQIDAKLTRTREGTGLGLAISRDLARGMGGELTAESVLGVGSTFTVTLPAAA